jgi:hypothetical protein
VAWLAIEDCACLGFFLWTGLAEERLAQLTPKARRDLAARIRTIRRSGREAWCTSVDGSAAGPLVVQTTHPDRPR